MVAMVARALLLFCVCSLAHGLTNIPGSGFNVRRVIPGNQMQAITFTPNGDLYMAWGATQQYCKWPNAANLAIGGTLSITDAVCGTGTMGSINFVSSQTGRIYNTLGYEIDKTTWVATKRWDDCGASHGIAIDPRDGAIFVSSSSSGKVWRIPNPDTYTGNYATDCVNDLFFNLADSNYGALDGITIGPDGTLYGAGIQNRFIQVTPYSAASPKGNLRVALPTTQRTPDGISICAGSGNAFALVAMTGSTIVRFNLTGPGSDFGDYAQTVIASDVGGYLDFTAVDPKGCIWGTTIFAGGLGTYRVTNADGTCSCASAQVPNPPPANATCPNCPDAKQVANPGESDFNVRAPSSGKCTSITFA